MVEKLKVYWKKLSHDIPAAPWTMVFHLSAGPKNSPRFCCQNPLLDSYWAPGRADIKPPWNGRNGPECRIKKSPIFGELLPHWSGTMTMGRAGLILIKFRLWHGDMSRTGHSVAAIGNYKLEKGRLLCTGKEICLAVRENGLRLLEIFMIMILRRLSIETQRPKYDLYNE